MTILKTCKCERETKLINEKRLIGTSIPWESVCKDRGLHRHGNPAPYAQVFCTLRVGIFKSACLLEYFSVRASSVTLICYKREAWQQRYSKSGYVYNHRILCTYENNFLEKARGKGNYSCSVEKAAEKKAKESPISSTSVLLIFLWAFSLPTVM